MAERDLPDDKLTAEIVIRMPSLDEVLRHGHSADEMPTIKRELMEYRAKFNSDPEFRRIAIAAFRGRQLERDREREREREL